MNHKVMETLVRYHLNLVLLSAFILASFVTSGTDLSKCTKVSFAETSTSKCLRDQKIETKNTSSAEDCALRCISRDKCGYFSYCNGSCHMHQLLYEKVIKDYDCKCSSYILLSGNDTRWQRVFDMTEGSFKSSPIYLYWDKLPIKKVEFQLAAQHGTFSYIFNGTGTNSTSWFHKDKIIANPYQATLYSLYFNMNFSYPHYLIEFNNEDMIEAKRKQGNNEAYDISYKSPSGTIKYNYESMIVAILFE